MCHADHLGRPVFATDSTGAVKWDAGTPTPFGDAANDNAAFGEAVQTAGAFAQRLMFPGQYQDNETGTDIVLSHNHHRTYDPTLGRYLQSDPIGLAGGLNRYAYVGGNPLRYVDPSGENPIKFFNDLRKLFKKAKIKFDGPDRGFKQKRKGKICQIRKENKPLIRSDFDEIPEIKGEKTLHLDFDQLKISYVPLNPRKWPLRLRNGGNKR